MRESCPCIEALISAVSYSRQPQNMASQFKTLGTMRGPSVTQEDITAVLKMFRSSALEQVAHNALVNAIVGSGPRWSKPGPELPGPEWNRFVEDIITAINLVGYAAYRVAIRHAEDPKNYRVAFEVAHVGDVQLQWNSDKKKWAIKSTVGSGWVTARSGSKRWRLLIVHTPEIDGDKLYLTSPAAVALRSCKTIDQIIENAVRRDTHNSLPTVYTSIRSNITSHPWSASNKPWFNATLPQIVPAAPVAAEDFNTLVENRAETIQVLDELSVTARERAQRQYEQNTRAITGKPPSKEETPRHRELVVSDGREYQVATSLKSTEDIRFIMDRAEETVLQAWGVPPLVIGRSAVNLKSGALTFLGNQSVSMFESKTSAIRDEINRILRFISSRISEDNYVSLASVFSEEKLGRYGHFLTNEARANAISALSGVDISSIDKEYIKDFTMK